ncbi:hypothetical protein [Streptomyces sp. NPDC056820]|uniref:hypothetical protein n=1 Tax=Streptomyces sp. NPDC056820 TaxID=3345951 RepID=UPI0036A3BD5F
MWLQREVTSGPEPKYAAKDAELAAPEQGEEESRLLLRFAAKAEVVSVVEVDEFSGDVGGVAGAAYWGGHVQDACEHKEPPDQR